ncbi:hypothetical protein [Embleya sp. MST-111070]
MRSAIGRTHPTARQADARTALLAESHASIVTAEWTTLPSVLAQTHARG